MSIHLVRSLKFCVLCEEVCTCYFCMFLFAGWQHSLIYCYGGRSQGCRNPTVRACQLQARFTCKSHAQLLKNNGFSLEDELFEMQRVYSWIEFFWGWIIASNLCMLFKKIHSIKSVYLRQSCFKEVSWNTIYLNITFSSWFD